MTFDDRIKQLLGTLLFENAGLATELEQARNQLAEQAKNNGKVEVEKEHVES